MECQLHPVLSSSVGKNYTCNAGDMVLIPGSGRSPGEAIGYPLQYSWASLVAHLLFVTVHRLLTALASLVVEYGL